MRNRKRPFLALFVIGMHLWGFFLSIGSLQDARTPQGSIAWAVSLNTIPYVAVPAYLIFGDSEVETYVTARRTGLDEVRPTAERLLDDIQRAEAGPAETSDVMQTISAITSLPVTKGNGAELLETGEETFQRIFEAIEGAKDYILVQFYIVRDDETGKQLKDRLVAKAREGVDVYFLFDNYGCMELPDRFVRELEEAGAKVSAFMDFGGEVNRFQLNFRNHRKLVVVDGKTGFVGGNNVGDEYLGKHPTLSPWKDCHLAVRGPVVTTLQIPFVEDWHWATGEIPDGLNWVVAERLSDEGAGQAQALAIASGPADPMETCSLFFLAAIHSAKERIWIATPYFVPDNAFVLALQLAAKRGVDVKVIIPEQCDSKLVQYSSYSYLPDLLPAGVEIWRYEEGFLHEKVLLVDDSFAVIGSANFDNRSFRLNFELGVGVEDRDFAATVAEMLETELNNSRLAELSDLTEQSWFAKVAVRVSRLLAPIQ